MCVGVTAAQPQEPNPTLHPQSCPAEGVELAPSTQALTQAEIGCVCVGFRTLTARFTPSNLYS